MIGCGLFGLMIFLFVSEYPLDSLLMGFKENHETLSIRYKLINFIDLKSYGHFILPLYSIK